MNHIVVVFLVLTLGFPQNINVVTGTQEVTVSDNNGNSTTHTLHLGSLELCKIGDYQDYIYKDNGKWYKYGAIQKLTLNGSENTWSNMGWTNKSGYRVDIDNIKQTTSSSDTSVVLSNYYTTYAQNTLASGDDKYGICNRVNQSQIIIRNDDYSTTTLFKGWLSEHNTTVYYVLATPTSTEITDDGLIQELEELYNMYSYSGTTNISISGNLPFIMKVRALTLS